MSWKRFLLAPAALLLLASAGSLISQIKTRVDLVVVPVSVRDNNGALITRLEQEDFKILEDGRPQTITNFSVDAQPLSVAIVIDDGINATALRRLVPLLSSITSAFQPEDEMTSFRYDHLVTRLSDFTSDRDQLAKSFREIALIAANRPDEPEPPAAIEKINRNTPGWLAALAGLVRIGSNGAPSSQPTVPTRRVVPNSRIMHTAVHEAALALHDRSIDRRKVVLLVSDGVVSEPQTSVIPGKTANSFEKNLEILLKDEVQVYSIQTSAALLAKPTGMLDSYSSATGGDVYGGRAESDMTFAFKRITEQARSQYVLGYVSNNTAPTQGVYRTIEVKSGDPDQKRKVSHRKGYVQYPIPK